MKILFAAFGAHATIAKDKAQPQRPQSSRAATKTFSYRGSTRRNADQCLLPLISTDTTDLNAVSQIPSRLGKNLIVSSAEKK
jgi:hypothetical protein